MLNQPDLWSLFMFYWFTMYLWTCFEKLDAHFMDTSPSCSSYSTVSGSLSSWFGQISGLSIIFMQRAWFILCSLSNLYLAEYMFINDHPFSQYSEHFLFFYFILYHSCFGLELCNITVKHMPFYIDWLCHDSLLFFTFFRSENLQNPDLELWTTAQVVGLEVALTVGVAALLPNPALLVGWFIIMVLLSMSSRMQL